MRGILTIGRTVFWLMGERRLGMMAAGVAFFAMLALFPALAAVIGLIGVLVDPVVVEDALEVAAEFLPVDAYELIEEQAAQLLDADAPALGLTSILSLLAAAWSARLGVDALMQGVNAIYGGSARGGIRNLMVALCLTLVLIAVGVTALFAMLVAPLVLAFITPFIPPGSWFPIVIEVLRWAISMAVLVVGLGIFYKYGPYRPETKRTRFFSPGLLMALCLWAAASIAFTLYLSYFDNFNEVYGSIGAVVVLMLWFYLSAYAVLLGAALNFTLEEGEEYRANRA